MTTADPNSKGKKAQCRPKMGRGLNDRSRVRVKTARKTIDRIDIQRFEPDTMNRTHTRRWWKRKKWPAEETDGRETGVRRQGDRWMTKGGEWIQTKNQFNRFICSKSIDLFKIDQKQKTRPLGSKAGERLIEKFKRAPVVDVSATRGGGRPNINKHTDQRFRPWKFRAKQVVMTTTHAHRIWRQNVNKGRKRRKWD